VHSKEAFEAFKQNMDSLRQAFQDSGFENANLNLSFADNSSSGAYAQQGERQQGSEQFFGNKTYSNYAASADSDDYGVESVSYETGLDKQVSIVA
ncbi:MAG: flagellar hook-length control protein FliK, partial [Spirochaetia bacterium]|nr:flagellar hook-length control protein FliK [Spirochaetia bacterium]